MTESTGTENQPGWQALDPLQRRVLGVLVEKAKTTPDAYPLTVNAIKTACNQKSNRHPQMDLDADDVQATLDELREIGVVAEIHGDGRSAKYRHKAYEWLGVDKVELAVMAELLLRGQQTVGELRGRAARMEPIDGLSELKPVLAGLLDRNLVVAITPAGRGQIVSHGLYLTSEHPEPRQEEPETAPAPLNSPATSARSAAPADGDWRQELEALHESVAQLTRRVEQLEQR